MNYAIGAILLALTKGKEHGNTMTGPKRFMCIMMCFL